MSFEAHIKAGGAAGCEQCKLRHMTCDGSHPLCFNCSKGDFHCSFTDQAINTPSGCTTKNSPLSPENPLPAGRDSIRKDGNQNLQLPVALPGASDSPSGPLNMTHLSLLYHYSTEAYYTYNIPRTVDLRSIMIRTALSNPFLMYEVLAIAALHLSVTTTNPSVKSACSRQSAELLGQALADFRIISKKIDSTTIVPAFLFSCLAGLHVFCDTFHQSRMQSHSSSSSPLAAQNTDQESFFDQLVHSINVLRGTQSVLEPWWSELNETELRPILQIASPDPSFTDAMTTHLELLQQTLLASPHLTTGEHATYERAISSLTELHRIEIAMNPKKPYSETRRVNAWLITISADYTKLLSRRQPEALVVLAYYAVSLHYCRAFWAIGNAGMVVLASVERYVGGQWSQWLAWPREEILGTRDES